MSDGSEEFKTGEFRGKVLGELEALQIGQKLTHDCIDRVTSSLDQFKVGIGNRVQNAEKDIVEMKTGLSVMAKIMWIIGTVAITALVGALLKLVVR